MVKIKVLIKNVEIGAEYENKICDFWITGQLESGKIIKIFDNKIFDLRDYINQKVEFLLVACFAHIINFKSDSEIIFMESSVIRGKFIKKYLIPSKWKKTNFSISYSAISTEDGILLLGMSTIDELKKASIKENEDIILDVGRFDLKDWNQI